MVFIANCIGISLKIPRLSTIKTRPKTEKITNVYKSDDIAVFYTDLMLLHLTLATIYIFTLDYKLDLLC